MNRLKIPSAHGARPGTHTLPYLHNIRIYPFKSLEPVSLDEARFLPSGALEGDRTFALFDAENKFVNGKRKPRIHHLRSDYDPVTGCLRLWRSDGDPKAAPPHHVDHDRPAIEAWLTEFFAEPVTLRRNTDVGFPDDLDCPGPTIISTATLAEVASWFPGLDVEQLRLRFRANLEIAGVPAFWEDHLYGVKGSLVPFRIGEVTLQGNNPCQRCAVPPRDPFTGQNIPEFAKVFAERRAATLPPWAEKSRFNHFYRLAINTIVRADEAGKPVRLGDTLELIPAAVGATVA
jgi:uncharacterized protein YcbX